MIRLPTFPLWIINRIRRIVNWNSDGGGVDHVDVECAIFVVVVDGVVIVVAKATKRINFYLHTK